MGTDWIRWIGWRARAVYYESVCGVKDLRCVWIECLDRSREGRPPYFGEPQMSVRNQTSWRVSACPITAIAPFEMSSFTCSVSPLTNAMDVSSTNVANARYCAGFPVRPYSYLRRQKQRDCGN